MKQTIIGILILFSINTYSQIWPYAPMDRFRNAVYYPIDSLKIDKLTGSNVVIDKKITDRYFDIILIKDSIGISINDSIIYFKQESRKEPKSYKEILFYNRRILTNSNTKIKYLKLISKNDDKIIALATVEQNIGKRKSKKKEIISINNNDIKGVFLGTGPTERGIVTALVISTTVLVVILI